MEERCASHVSIGAESRDASFGQEGRWTGKVVKGEIGALVESKLKYPMFPLLLGVNCRRSAICALLTSALERLEPSILCLCSMSLSSSKL